MNDTIKRRRRRIPTLEHCTPDKPRRDYQKRGPKKWDMEETPLDGIVGKHKTDKISMRGSAAIGVRAGAGRYPDKNVVTKLLNEEVEVGRAPSAKEAGTDDDPFEDQRVAQVEYLMLRGIEDPYTIKNTIGVHDVRLVKTYQKRVRARWRTGGEEDKGRMEAARVTAVRKLQHLQQKLWDMLDNGHEGRTLTANERLKAIEALERLITRVAEVEGVTKENVINIIQQSLNVGNDSAFHRSQEKTEMMRRIATRFNQLIGGGDSLVEGDYREVN